MLFALKKKLTKKFSCNVEKASDEEDVFDLEVLKRHQFTFYDICSGRGILQFVESPASYFACCRSVGEDSLGEPPGWTALESYGLAIRYRRRSIYSLGTGNK
jgi:hypothetical protein